MDSQTVVALAGIASGAIVTPVVTAFLTRRLLGEQHLAERESTDLVAARRIIMSFAARTVDFQDVSRQYGRELEQAVRDGGAITERLKLIHQELDDRAYDIDLGCGTFWHMVGYDSSVTVSHRSLIEHAKAIGGIAGRLQDAELLSSDDLTAWQAAADAYSVDFKRFAAAIGEMVGFRLPVPSNTIDK
jgi:hypothetical protein